MFYEDRVFNFQRKDRAKNWWVWGENRCSNVPIGLEDRISSMRFSGAPDDWKYDTINLYSGRAFTGSDNIITSLSFIIHNKRKSDNQKKSEDNIKFLGQNYTLTTRSPSLVTLTTEPGH